MEFSFYVALNGGLIGKDLEGSDCGLIYVFFLAFILRIMRKRRKSLKYLSVADILTEPRTEHDPVTSIVSYR
jgi:hypothetical protein